MKKSFLIAIHLAVLIGAGYWCLRLATKQLPHSGSTVEQWRQRVEQITNVTELHQKLVTDQEYILGSEALLEKLRWIAVAFTGVLTIYALLAVARTARKKAP
jgi:hypothetical protein